MQVTIARQLGLDPSTVSNFFMNARRRSVDKWREDSPARSVLTGPATLVQHIGQTAGQLSPTSLSASQLDLWQDLGEGDSPAPCPAPSQTVYIIPRDKLVIAKNSEADYDSDHVILDREELDTELDTEDDVDLDEDDCLDPPD